MKRTTILLTTALTVALALSGPSAAQGNDAQSGTNGDCLDYNLLYLVEGLDSPLAATVDAVGGTAFTLTAEDSPVTVDWRNEAGDDLGFNSAGAGTVPLEATYGIICVGVTGDYPDLPLPGATWTYQDGL